jgi:hypothetical protein
MYLLPPDGRSVFQLEIYVSSIHPIVVTGFRSQENTSLVGGGRVSRTAMDLFAFAKLAVLLYYLLDVVVFIYFHSAIHENN